jgi:hypothetical protein
MLLLKELLTRRILDPDGSTVEVAGPVAVEVAGLAELPLNTAVAARVRLGMR